MGTWIRSSRGGSLMVGVASVVLTACGSSDVAAPASSASPFPDSPAIHDVAAPLQPGTYHVDPDGDPSTPMRVHLTTPEGGWGPPSSSWRGIGKDFGSEQREILITITTVVNVAQDGCAGATLADPPVGPSVDDLAGALGALPPFDVTSDPSDVTAYGHPGKHLRMSVGDTSGCVEGSAFSWIEPGADDPFSGYGLVGTTEEFWILDVDGTRLMIAVMRRPGATPPDLAEAQSILDSIRIEAP